eukprot:1476786-Pyramimonas_sp.AAC.2
MTAASRSTGPRTATRAGTTAMRPTISGTRRRCRTSRVGVRRGLRGPPRRAQALQRPEARTRPLPGRGD